MIEVLIVASLVGAIPVSVYMAAEKEARAVDCISNLRNIYVALQLYESDYERLPNIKFYPENPESDPNSLNNVLGRYIDDKKAFLCPSMPLEIQKKKLTYIWNDSYNNSFSDIVESKGTKWLVTEMTVADSKIPPPHNGSFNVLFLDGHAAGVKDKIDLAPMPANYKKNFKDNFFVKNSLNKLKPVSGIHTKKRTGIFPKYVTL